MLKAVVFSIMPLVPYCRVQWLLIMFTVGLTSRLTEGQSFPGHISQYPSDQYVIQGEDFTATCIVTLTQDINVRVSFMWGSSVLLSNSSDTTVTSTQNGGQVIGRVIIRNARLSDTQDLKCVAQGFVNRKLVTVSQTSTIHSSEAPFAITDFPDEELQLNVNDGYTLKCVVTVAEQFPLRAVDVSIRYYSISPDVNGMPSVHYVNRERLDEERRTLTVSIFIQDVERKIGGTYECVAMTKQIENAVIPHYSEYSRTRISALDTETTQDSHSDSSDNKNWLTLLIVFSTITVALLIVFTFLVLAVIWTKRHRSRNYPVAPFPGTIPIGSTSGAKKSNYYSDSPEVSAVNKMASLQQPAMALHITPRLQSISSSETDV